MESAVYTRSASSCNARARLDNGHCPFNNPATPSSLCGPATAQADAFQSDLSIVGDM